MLPEPLAEQWRPKGKTPPQDVRRTLEAWPGGIRTARSGGLNLNWVFGGERLQLATGKTAPSFMGIPCFAAALHWLEP
jgi:hypothetical protein